MLVHYLTGFSLGIGVLALVLCTVSIASSVREAGEV